MWRLAETYRIQLLMEVGIIEVTQYSVDKGDDFVHRTWLMSGIRGITDGSW